MGRFTHFRELLHTIRTHLNQSQVSLLGKTFTSKSKKLPSCPSQLDLPSHNPTAFIAASSSDSNSDVVSIPERYLNRRAQRRHDRTKARLGSTFRDAQLDLTQVRQEEESPCSFGLEFEGLSEWDFIHAGKWSTGNDSESPNRGRTRVRNTFRKPSVSQGTQNRDFNDSERPSSVGSHETLNGTEGRSNDAFSTSQSIPSDFREELENSEDEILSKTDSGPNTTAIIIRVSGSSESTNSSEKSQPLSWDSTLHCGSGQDASQLSLSHSTCGSKSSSGSLFVDLLNGNSSNGSFYREKQYINGSSITVFSRAPKAGRTRIRSSVPIPRCPPHQISVSTLGFGDSLETGPNTARIGGLLSQNSHVVVHHFQQRLQTYFSTSKELSDSKIQLHELYGGTPEQRQERRRLEEARDYLLQGKKKSEESRGIRRTPSKQTREMERMRMKRPIGVRL